jgi:chemotaxis signal transduction protein
MLSRRENHRGARRAARPALLAFVIGGRPRALSVGLVDGVAEIGAVTHLPSSDPLNLGLIVHRGAVVPLVDLGGRLDGGRLDGGPTRAPAGKEAGTAAPGLCVVTRSSPALAFPVAAVLGLQPAAAPTDLDPSGGAPAWELLDSLVMDLARGQDPAD